MYQVVVMAILTGMVVGFLSSKAGSWFMTVTSKQKTANPPEPVPNLKRAYRKRADTASNKNAAVKSTSAAKGQRRKYLKPKTAIKNNKSQVAALDTVKRRGRPSKAAIAARQKAETEEKVIGSNTDRTDSAPKLSETDIRALLEKLSIFSPEQLYALAAMPISKSDSIRPEVTAT